MDKTMRKIFIIQLLTLIVGNNIVFTQNFRVPIQVKDNCGNSIIICLGVDPNATSGYDPGIDILAPPLPPGGFDARYRWLGENYFTDIRYNELNENSDMITPFFNQVNNNTTNTDIKQNNGDILTTF